MERISPFGSKKNIKKDTCNGLALLQEDQIIQAESFVARETSTVKDRNT